MLDHLDLSAVGSQRGAAGNFNPPLGMGSDAARGREIGSDKHNSRIRGRWMELDNGVASTPVSESRDRALVGQGPLLSQGCRQGCTPK
jgi:hypothetical protein